MYNQKNPEDTLLQWYLEGKNIQQLCKIAEQKGKAIQAEKAKQDAEAAERSRLKRIEDMRPENKYPKVWRYKHVYRDELNEYLSTYSIDELEAYAVELMAGKHREQFSDPDVALNYLLTQISMRKNAHPAQEVLKVTREMRKAIEGEQKQMKAAINALQNTINPNSTQKMKAYTA